MNFDPTAWDEQQRLWAFAIAMSITALLALALVDFRVESSVMVPWVAVAYVAKALWPRVPSLVPAIAGFVFPFTMTLIDDDEDFVIFMTVASIIFVTIFEPDQRKVTAYVLTVLLAMAVFGGTGTYSFGWFNWMAAFAISWGFGALIRRYQAAAEELQRTQAHMIDQATLIERRRMARDVHDLVGHSLSVVMLHVSGARRLIRSDPDEAEVALLQAEEAGRASMADIRRSVGVMREDGEGDGSAPTPDLLDIKSIVEQYSAAGLEVDYSASGPLEAVDGPLALTVYRITQEALANVSKHTTGGSASVVVEVDDANCRIEVSNRGGERLRSSSSTDFGHGLVGMRERAQAAGGSLVVGPVGDGWSVEFVAPRVTQRR